MDSGWELLLILVRGRERTARPGESSITVTSVTGSEMSVRADEKPSWAETARWAVVRERGSRGGRTVLVPVLAAVVDGPGSALGLSLPVSNCGEKDHLS